MRNKTGRGSSPPKTVFWFMSAILVLGAFLRLWLLGSVPQGFTHDEMGYVYNAYAISQTGKNIFGEPLPVFTWMITGGFPFMPVPIYSMVPLFWIVPLVPFTARLLPAILGIIDIYLLFYILLRLFRNTPVAVLSALFLAISPWHLHFARSAYDANFSLFFLLLGIAAFLRDIPRNKLPFISLGALFLFIYSYRGMSIIAFPVAFVLFAYAYVHTRITKRQGIVFVLGVILCGATLLFTMFRAGPGFSAEANHLFTSPKIQEDIDIAIREAKGPLLLRRIFLNKPTYIATRLWENYLKTYSPEFLFLYTEPSAIYSIWSRGRVYLIDLLFIFPGILYLFNTQKKAALLWLGFLLIGGLPGGIGGLPYSSRNFFLSAVLPVFTAAGIVGILSLPRQRLYKFVIGVLMVVLYMHAHTSYLFDYYGRYAYQGAEGWAKSLKDLSISARKAQDSHTLVYIGNFSVQDLALFAFWNRLNPQVIQNAWITREEKNFTNYYRFENIVFSGKCIDQRELSDPQFKGIDTMAYIATASCHNEATPSGYIKEYNGNDRFKLFEINFDQPETFRSL